MEYRGSKSITGLYIPTSYFKPEIVKEQRVDGNWQKRYSLVFKVYSNGLLTQLSSQNPFIINNKLIGNTLYQGSVPCLTRKLKLVNTNLFSKCLNFTTASQVSRLPAWWISGFVDAEGCFRISIIKNKNYKGDPWSPSLYSEKAIETKRGVGNNALPLSVRLYFQIGLHLKDEAILNLIKSELGVGEIYRSKSRPDSIELKVSSFKDMAALIEFFLINIR